MKVLYISIFCILCIFSCLYADIYIPNEQINIQHSTIDVPLNIITIITGNMRASFLFCTWERNSCIGEALGFTTDVWNVYPNQLLPYDYIPEYLSGGTYLPKYMARINAVVQNRINSTYIWSLTSGGCFNPSGPSPNWSKFTQDIREDFGYGHHTIVGCTDEYGYTGISIEEAGSELATYLNLLSAYPPYSVVYSTPIELNAWLKVQVDGFFDGTVNPYAVLRFARLQHELWCKFVANVGIKQSLTRGLCTAGYIYNDSNFKLIAVPSFWIDGDPLPGYLIIDPTYISSECSMKLKAGEAIVNSRSIYKVIPFPVNGNSERFLDINYGLGGLVAYSDDPIVISSGNETVAQSIATPFGSHMVVYHCSPGEYNISFGSNIKLFTYNEFGKIIKYESSIHGGNIDIIHKSAVAYPKLKSPKLLKENDVVVFLPTSAVVTAVMLDGFIVQDDNYNIVRIISNELPQLFSKLSYVKGSIVDSIEDGKLLVAEEIDIKDIDVFDTIRSVGVVASKAHTTKKFFARVVGKVTNVFTNNIELDNCLVVNIPIDGISLDDTISIVGVYVDGEFYSSNRGIVYY